MSGIQRAILAAAVLSSTAATWGCNTESFNAINSTLASVNKTANLTQGSARLPTAAIATAMGGVELVKALSSKSTPLIAAGSRNYSLQQFAPGTNVTETIDQNGVKATVTYSSKVDEANQTVESEITSFKGNTQGYAINAAGKFTYKPRTRSIGDVSAMLKGDLSYKTLKVELREVSFATEDPMPKDAATIGKFVLFADDAGDKTLFDASVGIKAGKIVAKAEVTVNGKKQPNLVDFSEDSTTDLEAPAKSAGNLGPAGPKGPQNI
ncbi:MAG: hypothetical protein VKP62_07250 [Candidatus Sericytochromatia bacterium]|nr:hypothetical protein [Candidatus Sericytochromatia bacterium]